MKSAFFLFLITNSFTQRKAYKKTSKSDSRGFSFLRQKLYGFAL